VVSFLSCLAGFLKFPSLSALLSDLFQLVFVCLFVCVFVYLFACLFVFFFGSFM